jgi:hypothetical protein
MMLLLVGSSGEARDEAMAMWMTTMLHDVVIWRWQDGNRFLRTQSAALQDDGQVG